MRREQFRQKKYSSILNLFINTRAHVCGGIFNVTKLKQSVFDSHLSFFNFTTYQIIVVGLGSKSMIPAPLPYPQQMIDLVLNIILQFTMTFYPISASILRGRESGQKHMQNHNLIVVKMNQPAQDPLIHQ